MKIIKLEFSENDDFVGFLKKGVEGEAFHVALQANWPSIEQCGGLLPNTENAFTGAFGALTTYCRSVGGVSIFDYRTPPTRRIQEFRDRCRPFDALNVPSEGIVILILSSVACERLTPWTAWRDEGRQTPAGAASTSMVPEVEACHPGRLGLDDIKEAVFVTVQYSADTEEFLAALDRIYAAPSATVRQPSRFEKPFIPGEPGKVPS